MLHNRKNGSKFENEGIWSFSRSLGSGELNIGMVMSKNCDLRERGGTHLILRSVRIL